MELEEIWKYHLRLGDRYFIKGEKDNAIFCYLEATEHLVRGEYLSMAAAVMAQILRLDDTRADVRIQLAHLYRDFGVDFQTQERCREAASRYESAGRMEMAREIFRIMIDLKPREVSTAEDLAECFYAAG